MQNQTELRVYTACLETLKKIEDVQTQKIKIEAIISKLKATRQKRVMNQLAKSHYQILQSLFQIFVAIKKSFDQISKLEENASIQRGFQITKYLIGILPNVPISKEKVDRQTILTKCFVYLTINFKKEIPSFNNKLVGDWSKKAKEKLKEEQQKNANKRKEEEIEQVQKKKTQPTIPTTHYQKQKPIAKQSSEEEDQSSQENDYTQRKYEQEKPKQNRESTQQRARDVQRQKIQRDEERKKEDERKTKQRNQKQADARQQTKISKGRANNIQKYIDSRRDLAFQKGKNREVTQFLAAKLDQFLKNTLEQLYNIACLKNKKNPKFGNQLGYFAEQNQRVEYSNRFYFQPNTKIYSLSYKHKHQIYSSLRIKEVKKEDELRNALEAKTNEGEKKIEKRIENYILKPRPKQTQAFLIPYRDQKQFARGQTNPSVSISLQHFVYFLQNHSWLKNSLLLFNVYHRF